MPRLPPGDAGPRDALKKLAAAAGWFVALLHAWFFVLETFLWRTPFAQASLQMTAAEAEATAILAGNQGVYNAVFAAGLGWSLVAKKQDLLRFFLGAIIGVGIYGAVSARVTILFTQALPAVIALALTSTAGASAGSSTRRD